MPVFKWSCYNCNRVIEDNEYVMDPKTHRIYCKECWSRVNQSKPEYIIYIEDICTDQPKENEKKEIEDRVNEILETLA